ncbi:transposase [Pontibacter sp. 172403-2]|uniref:transposase n=1 Tax=Pontibacter rufus TaxID=2791028 RepID=UPI00351BF7B4
MLYICVKTTNFTSNKKLMNFAFKTIHEFNDHFKDEKICYEFLEEQRWQDGIACPHCGSLKNHIM